MSLTANKGAGQPATVQQDIELVADSIAAASVLDAIRSGHTDSGVLVTIV